MNLMVHIGMHINTYVYHVYILTNRYNSVLYTGFTGKGVFRIEEHKTKSKPGFTTMYKVDKLVYVEQFDDVYKAIAREKQIKGWSRKKKDVLIESINPKWIDLYEDFKKGKIPKRNINNNSDVGGRLMCLTRSEKSINELGVRCPPLYPPGNLSCRAKPCGFAGRSRDISLLCTWAGL